MINNTTIHHLRRSHMCTIGKNTLKIKIFNYFYFKLIVNFFFLKKKFLYIVK
jgi:hypothetical protein